MLQNLLSMQMGRNWRKLRFYHRKRKQNVEPEREPLLVSISLALLAAQVLPSCVPAAIQSDRDNLGAPLTVSISLSLITCTRLLTSITRANLSAHPVLTIQELHHRLEHPGCLPDGWTRAKSAPSELVVCNLSQSKPDVPPLVKYTVTVTESLLWTVHIFGQLVQTTQLMPSQPCRLETVSEFFSLLQHLKNFQVCCGNSEDKFIQLAHKKRGKFCDKAGGLS